MAGYDIKVTDDDFTFSKELFHENVLKSLTVECDDDTGVYMIMMSIKEENRLYIEYFKAITRLERSKEKEMIVEVL